MGLPAHQIHLDREISRLPCPNLRGAESQTELYRLSST